MRKYCKLILGAPGMPDYVHSKWWYQLEENFSIYLQVNSSFTRFLICYILKDPAIWLANRILAHNSRTRYAIGGEISITLLVFILVYFQEKLKTKFSKK